MKKILFLLTVCLLLSCLLTACFEETPTPPAENGADDSLSASPDEKNENDNDDPNGSTNSGNDNGHTPGDSLTDINGDGVIDENDQVGDNPDSSNPEDDTNHEGGSTIPPADPMEPAVVEYDLDYRLAESPDDMIFTCIGASNQTLAGSVSILATYKEQYPVVSVWIGAFRGCTGITSVTVAEGITAIYTEAFAYCTSLTDVYLPSTLTSIDMEAFAGCTNLVNIHFAGTRAQWIAITKGDGWQPSSGQYTVHCTDGDIVVTLK